jgi:hypothetical protein
MCVMSGAPTTDSRLTPRGGRLTTSLLVGTIAVLAMATPAMAKVPYFTIELEGGPTAPGESLGIIVRMYEDAEHTKPADWLGASVPDVIAVVPEDGGYAESIDVLLEETAPGVYHGSVVIPSAGTWIVRPFPDPDVWGDMGAVEGYPDDIIVQVAEPGPSLPVIVSIVVAFAGIAGLLAIVARRSIGRLDPKAGTADPV